MLLHAKLSASGSHRWLNCPGSVAAEASLPPRPNSSFSDEGTRAHALADAGLTTYQPASTWLGKLLPDDTKDVAPIEAEMCAYVQEYIDYVSALAGQHEYEQRVNFSDYVPEGFGTADAIVTNGETLTVVDLKYGKGVPVSAERNSQAMLYALGALSEREAFQSFTKVVIVIHQPRLDSISEWETTPDELRTWGKWVSQQAAKCLEPSAERVAGEKQCQWCTAKPICPALMAKAEQTLMAQFDGMDAEPPRNPDTLSDEQLRLALDNKKLIASWLDAVEDHVTERLVAGDLFKGYKLVAGRSTRRWVDEVAAEDLLKILLDDNAYAPRKLISAPQAEKLLGKADAAKLAPLIVKPAGAPTLAKDDDGRAPIGGATADDFN